MKSHWNGLIRLVLITAFAALSGCATVQTMTPSRSATSVDTSKKSLLLLTITPTNEYKQRYQPHPTVVNVERANAKQSSDYLNFRFDRDSDFNGVDGKSYFVRLALAPGKYVLRGVSGIANAFPFIGNFFIPLHFDIEVKPNQIEYLGHIDASIVKRKDGEFRAGALIPLIDQAATGCSGGTWRVAVSDRTEQDIAEFKSEFPAIANANIENDTLPAWDKAKATRWWKAH